MNKTVLIGMILSILLCMVSANAGCSGSAVIAAVPTTPPTTAPAAAAGAGQTMATVNGQPIYMDELNEILLYSYGLPVAQQLIANELVRQECVRHSISVTPQEIAKQHDQALVQMFPDLEPAQRQRAFEQFLMRKSVTRKQWDFTMQRMALLAKLAELRIKITPDDLAKAFGDRYGQKVVIRHIQVATLAEAQNVLSQLQKGADFAELAQKKSTSPTRANGGLLMPLSLATTGFPPAIKDVALAMTKVGQLSQVVQAGTAFHVLRLEQIIPPQNVKFDDIKEKLKISVHEERVQMLQQQILMELIKEAQEKGSVNFSNPVLRQLWQASLQNQEDE